MMGEPRIKDLYLAVEIADHPDPLYQSFHAIAQVTNAQAEMILSLRERVKELEKRVGAIDEAD